MSIQEKIEKYLVNEGKDEYKYDTMLADNIADIIETHLKGKNAYIKGEKLIKKEIKEAKKRTGYKGKNWKELLQDAVDNLEIMYDYEIHDAPVSSNKGNKISNFIDILEKIK